MARTRIARRALFGIVVAAALAWSAPAGAGLADQKALAERYARS